MNKLAQLDLINIHTAKLTAIGFREEKGNSPRRISGRKCMSFLTTPVVNVRVKIFSWDKFLRAGIKFKFRNLEAVLRTRPSFSWDKVLRAGRKSV